MDELKIGDKVQMIRRVGRAMGMENAQGIIIRRVATIRSRPVWMVQFGSIELALKDLELKLVR